MSIWPRWWLKHPIRQKGSSVTKWSTKSSSSHTKVHIYLRVVLSEVWEELKAALIIAYPNFEGLGEWEAARAIHKGEYIWENINTNQIDVQISLSSIWMQRMLQCGGLAKNFYVKNYLTHTQAKIRKPKSSLSWLSRELEHLLGNLVLMNKQR